jgi:hypothetical protein
VKKALALMLLIAAAIVVPVGAMADDVRTPSECKSTPTADDPQGIYQMGNADGRASLCVSDGDETNGNEVYVGGDATQPCGHIEVLGVIAPVSDESDTPPEAFCH